MVSGDAVLICVLIETFVMPPTIEAVLIWGVLKDGDRSEGIDREPTEGIVKLGI